MYVGEENVKEKGIWKRRANNSFFLLLLLHILFFFFRRERCSDETSTILILYASILYTLKPTFFPFKRLERIFNTNDGRLQLVFNNKTYTKFITFIWIVLGGKVFVFFFLFFYLFLLFSFFVRKLFMCICLVLCGCAYICDNALIVLNIYMYTSNENVCVTRPENIAS